MIYNLTIFDSIEIVASCTQMSLEWFNTQLDFEYLDKEDAKGRL